MRNSETFSGKCMWQIRICIEGHVDLWIEDYFGGVSISHKKDGSSILTGERADISAVYGLILKLRDSGINLLSLQVEKAMKGEK
ncbi:hypothetical protein RBH29_06535 [Herbivorax sp. ANBcel31]|uniref:hypothetical protein n=1 Tax=Herbivorax sp. ANBcel31 TaxID=3069754 RepID=UPI0027B37CD2|nr:hypothetical protein [Herbivorax sp. ANBcel31]MDQ2086089.1 hypothetical protein [Herbivorax sp. ANBcel31]